MGDPAITLSIVSHRQNGLLNLLLQDLELQCANRVALVVITQNIPDSVPLAIERLCCPVEIVHNAQRKGFGANHNAAFAHCQTPYFCVANPDIRFGADPFPPLVATCADPSTGVTGPLVKDPSGSIEDSARRFPTAASLVRKAFSGSIQPDYSAHRSAMDVDWIAGMFMLFRSDAFSEVGGFDPAYFLYYEDVDICRRLHAASRRVIYQTDSEVVHDARRASRRDPRLARHHLASVIRFLASR